MGVVLMIEDVNLHALLFADRVITNYKQSVSPDFYGCCTFYEDYLQESTE